ncbi:hypothetical protein SNE40_004375 [Patella caerulea]|uniref:Uncharacterized protein n=1 Tax=Patella caerulea TaxID=87958 RepID=A0AAN8PX44_PATCE
MEAYGGNIQADDVLMETLEFSKFAVRRARTQICILQNKLYEVQIRYQRAKRAGLQQFQYVLEQRLTIIEDTLSMYTAYAEKKANYICSIENWLDRIELNSRLNELEINEAGHECNHESLFMGEFRF